MINVRSLLRPAAVLLVVMGAAMAGPAPLGASHTWGNYHWGRTSNPFTLTLADNVSSQWDAHLAVASADWTASSVLDTVVRPGAANPKNCRPTAGRVEVCNYRYGNNGWLGIAQIWASGSHITQGVVKLNDTYFNQPSYNKPEWRQFVTCQEIGHIFGLGHVNEVFDDPNTGSCMDYTNDPGTNQHPNAHDYELLAAIYGHADSSTTVRTSSASAGAGSAQDDWGRGVHGHTSGGHTHNDVFVKDLGNGQSVITHVFWANHSH